MEKILDKEEKIEAELASRIPVGNMDDTDIGRIKDVEVPENPYRITEIQGWTETRIESDENVSDETIRTETVETAESVEEFEKTVDTVVIKYNFIIGISILSIKKRRKSNVRSY